MLNTELDRIEQNPVSITVEDVREMATEIRRCHKRIDDLLVANNQELDRRRHAELRAIAAESCRALEDAVSNLLETIRKQA